MGKASNRKKINQTFFPVNGCRSVGIDPAESETEAFKSLIECFTRANGRKPMHGEAICWGPDGTNYTFVDPARIEATPRSGHRHA